MEITEIKVYPVNGEGPLKAYVSIVLDSGFAVHDLKVIQGTSKLFVAMPNKKDKGGNWRDIVHPINQDARTMIEEEILTRYNTVLSEQPADPEPDQE